MTPSKTTADSSKTTLGLGGTSSLASGTSAGSASGSQAGGAGASSASGTSQTGGVGSTIKSQSIKDQQLPQPLMEGVENFK